jgi:hypothetical protein
MVLADSRCSAHSPRARTTNPVLVFAQSSASTLADEEHFWSLNVAGFALSRQVHSVARGYDYTKSPPSDKVQLVDKALGTGTSAGLEASSKKYDYPGPGFRRSRKRPRKRLVRMHS